MSGKGLLLLFFFCLQLAATALAAPGGVLHNDEDGLWDRRIRLAKREVGEDEGYDHLSQIRMRRRLGESPDYFSSFTDREMSALKWFVHQYLMDRQLSSQKRGGYIRLV